ncbi:putative MFS family arabinose efflux permease [Lentzea atacamensis]|uniref:MFS family arabinose efflux permease n=1 Tax=Lentzea atacamensis TaxID=531938 RepID=A0A316HRU3_9PSEU|nr:MFS transporter [Lentzea atacamensis]PWK83176.1 putative MFS family arabinose efflux permease [Lentzea atacamensis]RAS58106.1 putative MFS family arabinose efflux permease [Lentzea atacamensis]
MRERLPVEVWVLVAASFIIAVGFGIVAPVLPVYAATFGVGHTAIAALISSFAFVRLAFAPMSGKLVNRFGEPNVYIVGILIVAVGTALSGFSGSYAEMLTWRALAGVGSTMFTVAALGLLIRITPAPLRGRASGMWAAGFLIGNVAGPIVGAGLVPFGLWVPFVSYGVMLCLAAFVVWFFLRRSTLAALDKSNSDTPMSVREAVKHRAYRAALASGFANGWAVFGVRISLVPVFVIEALKHSPAVAGISMSVFAGGNAAMLFLSGKIADTRGRKPVAIAGLVVSGLATIWMGFTGDVWTFMAASLIAGMGAGLLNPPQNAVVADVIGARGKGGPVLAGFQMVTDLGAIIGPMCAGLLADSFGFEASFAITGAALLLSVAFWFVAPETLPTHEEEHTAAAVAPECGCLDESAEVPTGERVGGKPRHPEA